MASHPVEKLHLCARGLIKKVRGIFKKGKELEKFTFLDGKYLLLNDGTGFCSSKKVHCKNCCEKHHRTDGSVTYYHQMKPLIRSRIKATTLSTTLDTDIKI